MSKAMQDAMCKLRTANIRFHRNRITMAHYYEICVQAYCDAPNHKVRKTIFNEAPLGAKRLIDELKPNYSTG